MRCPQCKGKGQIQQYKVISGFRAQARRGSMMVVRCPTCQGKGEVFESQHNEKKQTDYSLRWTYIGFLSFFILTVVIWLLSKY